MKASKAFQVLTMAMLLPLLSGCLSTLVSRSVVGSKSDWFSPTALYKSKADGSLAVEGTLTKAGEQSGVPAYLVIPQNVLVAAHLQTKGNITFNDITSLPPRVRQGLCLRKKLNSDYEKIASVQNQGGMDVNQEATVNIKAVGLLPFAFVVDAVTFPLQIYIGKKAGENPIN
jgi:uncharacterized protein YceK